MSQAQSIQWLLDHLDDPDTDDHAKETESTESESKIENEIAQDNSVARKVSQYLERYYSLHRTKFGNDHRMLL